MSIETVTQEFRSGVSECVRLSAQGPDRFRVLTPFMFNDGDHLVIVLKRERDGWVLSDEAHTYMHLADELDDDDRQGGMCDRIIAKALAMFRIEDRGGELIHPITNEGLRRRAVRFRAGAADHRRRRIHRARTRPNRLRSRRGKRGGLTAHLRSAKRTVQPGVSVHRPWPSASLCRRLWGPVGPSGARRLCQETANIGQRNELGGDASRIVRSAAAGGAVLRDNGDHLF